MGGYSMPTLSYDIGAMMGNAGTAMANQQSISAKRLEEMMMNSNDMQNTYLGKPLIKDDTIKIRPPTRYEVKEYKAGDMPDFGSMSPKTQPISINADTKTTKKESFMKELITDAKGFMKEHKSLFYWIALIALADHFIFEGTFREKLKAIVQKMIGKLEAKVDNAS